MADVNAHLTTAELERVAPLSGQTRALLAYAIETLHLSARSYHRIWRLARTLADLTGDDVVGDRAIAEALPLRRVGNKTTGWHS